MVRDPGLLASRHQQGGAVSELPTGTVTFLFTDLESSTRLWEQDPEAMRAALAQHASSDNPACNAVQNVRERRAKPWSARTDRHLGSALDRLLYGVDLRASAWSAWVMSGSIAKPKVRRTLSWSARWKLMRTARQGQ